MTVHSALSRRGGVLLATLLLAVALGGCLKFPLGDPETSRVDPSFNGVWFKRGEAGEVVLWSVQPFDSRCYLIINYTARPDGGGGWERGGFSVSKGWLSQIKGRTFLTMQAMTNAPADAPYVVALIEREGETIVARGIKPDFVKENAVESADAFARLVEANVDNPAMYLDPDRYEKTGDADAETVQTILRAFH
ncbi:MAG: hypothetical protein NZ561_04660 [Phycisphaerae bacterium]|nr:hypothetical protein [Phycisphaerae bacterium]MDW8262632.1 hypothetical protein [Phycisphaerales bacterium]